MFLKNDMRQRTVQVMVGATTLVLIPMVQFGLIYSHLGHHHQTVDRDSCLNHCWDSVFKEGYEKSPGRYKHIYFNTTWQTGLIWAITVAFMLALYESLKYLMGLWLTEQLSVWVAFMFLSSVFPHVYGWWMYFNYINDGFYSQLWHQLGFTMTELVSSLALLQVSNSRTRPRTGIYMYIVVSVACGHILVSGLDQFVQDMFGGTASLSLVVRDLGLMLPDLANLGLGLRELRQWQRKTCNPLPV